MNTDKLKLIWRTEGYLPKEEFHPQLEIGIARVSLMRKRWSDAEQIYERITKRFPNSEAAPEAVYWRGVCEYFRTKDHLILKGSYTNGLTENTRKASGRKRRLRGSLKVGTQG